MNNDTVKARLDSIREDVRNNAEMTARRIARAVQEFEQETGFPVQSLWIEAPYGKVGQMREVTITYESPIGNDPETVTPPPPPL